MTSKYDGLITQITLPKGLDYSTCALFFIFLFSWLMCVPNLIALSVYNILVPIDFKSQTITLPGGVSFVCSQAVDYNRGTV